MASTRVLDSTGKSSFPGDQRPGSSLGPRYSPSVAARWSAQVPLSAGLGHPALELHHSTSAARCLTRAAFNPDPPAAMSTRLLHSRRRMGTALVTFAVLVGFVLTTAPGFAIGPGSGPGGGPGGGDKGGGGKIIIPPGGPPGGGGSGPPPQPIPEISPGSAVGALMLLAGGTLILADRFRRRSSPSASPIAPPPQ